tara:strand:- start:34860 stop:35687 length:828 start_codon:yes stop_codon:yes gene_type:complete
MSFISYAQNFEDVILNRVFKNITNGFYIDVGAYSPSEHSVTKTFYDRGWHGINIEPVASYYKKFPPVRPNDINLNIAVSDKEAELKFYEVKDTGLSTLNPEIAEMHRNRFNVTDYTIKVNTLSQVLKQHTTKNQTIHFLKIDVEGHEKEVVLGLDLNQYRPWVVVIEATKPLSEEILSEPWESMLTDKNYTFVYFDGLNNFYLANEHSNYRSCFQLPPNFFDGYIPFERNEFIKLGDTIKQLEAEKQAILNSHSWKITKPLRAVSDFFRRNKESS